mmetsp:Transcript_7205/g.8270  ORF Transcript_7205/g.8270 Transcript_7205/m.8270 type:complete len:353 (-) Transcript_7205:66-1124(-)
MYSYDFFNMFHGENPGIRTAKQRRNLKSQVDESFQEAFPDIIELEKEFSSKGGQTKEEYFKTSRGLSLFSRTLVPDVELAPLRGAIMYCHGYTDDIQFQSKKSMLKYANLGYVVAAIEMEGHGYSDGLSCLLPDVDAATQDAYEFLQQKRKEYSTLKWLVHGESMGGMFALNLALLAQSHKNPFHGVVLLAPMCKIAEEVKPAPPIISFLRFLSKAFPTLSLTPTSMDDSLVFRDPKMMSKIKSNPIKYAGRPRLATAVALLQSTLNLEKKLVELATPFFIMHGSADVVTSPEASKELYENSKVDKNDKELVILEDQWHGFMGEAPEVVSGYWKTVLDWANSRTVISESITN